MSAALIVPPITVEQYWKFKGVPGYRDELIDGEIIMSPQPKPFHQQIVKNLLRLIEPLLNTKHWTVQSNMNIELGIKSAPAPDVFVVDIEAWREACVCDRYLNVCPVLAIEVLSKANKARNVAKKKLDYLATGSDCVWIVYPKTRKVRVFWRGESTCREYTTMDRLELPENIAGSVSVDEIFWIK